MGIKVEVTIAGANYESDGVIQSIPVGTELSFEGDQIPSFLVNKCRVIGETKGKKLEVTAEKSADKKAE